MKRKSNRRGEHVLAPSEWALPKYKLVKKEGGWWFEPDGAEPMFGPAATPGSRNPRCSACGAEIKPRQRFAARGLTFCSAACYQRAYERRITELLALARRNSTDPECIAAVQTLMHEQRLQLAEFQRWHRRASLVREYWLRKYRAQTAKLQRCSRRATSFPNSALLKPRQGERDAVDPRLMQWIKDLGCYILAQDNPEDTLARLLGRSRPGKRAKNKERDVSIAGDVATKMDGGMTLEEAADEVAQKYWKKYRLGSDAVIKIYTRNKIEGRATRHKV
jgi:hypothetical protein